MLTAIVVSTRKVNHVSALSRHPTLVVEGSPTCPERAVLIWPNDVVDDQYSEPVGYQPTIGPQATMIWEMNSASSNISDS